MSLTKKVNKKTPIGKSRYGGTRFATARSVTVSTSASKRSVTMAGIGERAWMPSKPPVQVIDENGFDVTPLPLLSLDPAAIKKHQSTILETSDGTPTDPRSSASAFNKTGAAISTLYGGGPFTRSVFSQSETSDSYMDDIHDSAADLVTTWADIQHLREDVKEVLSESDFEKEIVIDLSETPMIWLLDIPGMVFMEDEEKMTSVKVENDKYIELKKVRIGNDLYMERAMNTFNEPPKYKNTQTTRVGIQEIGVTATVWDMYDTYSKSEIGHHGTVDKAALDGHTVQTLDPETCAPIHSDGPMASDHKQADASDTRSESEFDSKFSLSAETTDAQVSASSKAIFSMPQFARDLFIMERAMNLNTYQNKQALYRGFPLVIEHDTERKPSCMDSSMSMPDMGPHVDRLWSYYCPLIKGHNVSSLTWNKINPDLVAVGYGQFEFSHQKTGLVCCWSLKNPNYPERIVTCDHGVMSLDFSRVNPNYLAAGLHNGAIVIYNVRSAKDESIIDSFNSVGKHSAPVWHIQWINKDRSTEDEKAEVLISVSADGRVTQWSIRKGFEQFDLMKLKRLPTRMQGKVRERKGEAYISRYAGGFSFDFHPKDPNVYLVTTDDGFVHKCSCSYIEQYLETYSGHSEPVYKVKWSHFEPQLFLTCSADWSIRLWHHDRQKAIFVFHSSTIQNWPKPKSVIFDWRTDGCQFHALQKCTCGEASIYKMIYRRGDLPKSNGDDFVLEAFRYIEKSVYDICWSPTTPTVFACVNEEAVEVWDLTVSILDPVIKNSGVTNAKMTCVQFANNSESLLVGDSDGQVTVFQLKCMPKHKNVPLMAIVESCLENQLSTSDGKPKAEVSDHQEEFDD